MYFQCAQHQCNTQSVAVRTQRCNVRNIDWLVVALDEPECVCEEGLAQLVNTGQPCFYKYLLFKVCAPQ